MNEVAQVTEFCDPRSYVETPTGKMHYDLWCQRESNRWYDKWRILWVQANAEGQIALFTHADDQLPIEGDDPKE